ncbi:MAG: hypothetical protein FD123_2207 [Bacteroidetes bacterium]|nr:MAG: hypothetical protein FD123_2207 [Bacteroidota bacterium]
MPRLLIITLLAFSFQLQVHAQQKYSRKDLDSAWTSLKQLSGCLTGGQNVHNGRAGGERSALTYLPQWQKFLSIDRDSLAPFLIRQIADTDSTNTHTCPCYVAKEGELAIYCLHAIYLQNWYELPEFKKYKNKEGSGCSDTHQSWLWEIIGDPKSAQKMKNAWTAVYTKSKKGK